MAKKMLIDATHPEETRVVVADGNKVEEFDFESENKRQLAGNIYLAKVTRVEPSLQAAFVDYGGNRHGFLAFSEIHPDYYQIPVADRQALLEEEMEYARQQAEQEDEEKPKRKSRSRSRSRSKAAEAKTDDVVVSEEVATEDGAEVAEAIPGMDVVDLNDDDDADAPKIVEEGSSPMETVAETPVETPAADEEDDTDDEDDGVIGATEKDTSIESVAQEDDADEVRPARKPRPKRYKIQEVVKVRQILLVQVVKEERGNKGAALTTYLSLAGRYCVLMPNTARGGGISRKITNAADRKKLKEIANEIDVPKGAGLIVRTAGAKRTKSEIKRDYEYLQRHWEQVRELTLKSIAPAPIYEEGDLIKRSIRDLYNREIDEVVVEGEAGYKDAKAFMKMIMPSHAKNVKQYADPMPLFARHQVESYLSGMFNPTVQLPSGGYIVIGITEALVAVDVNSGRATKEGSIEQTALKTNLEAAEEVARQMRLRDLAGLIVIDFIDMEERRNNNAVEKRLKDKLKTDRARIQVGRISGFGLLEMSRQRLRPGMLEATTQPCPHCHGTGLIRSDDSLALTILRQLEEEGTRKRTREVLLTAPVAVINYLMNAKREHIAEIEARYGMAVRLEADPHMISPDFKIEKFKTATRNLSAVVAKTAAISMDSIDMTDIDEAIEAEAEAAEADAAPANELELDEDGNPKKKKRRRRRGGRGRNRNRDRDTEQNAEDTPDAQAEDAEDNDPRLSIAEAKAAEGEQSSSEDAPVEEEKPKRKRRTRAKKADTADSQSTEAPAEEPVAEAAAEEEEKPKPKRRTRKTKEPEAEAKEADATSGGNDAVSEEPKAEEEQPKPKKRRSRAKAKPAEDTAEAAAAEPSPAPEPVADAQVEAKAEPVEEPAPKPKRTRTRTSGTTPMSASPDDAGEVATEEKPKSKRRGWWNLGRG
ncbi:MAG: ribonuclease E/G [Litoreibacter sp.]|nr:ribonuclease E/G [Litoreibacter sp.]